MRLLPMANRHGLDLARFAVAQSMPSDEACAAVGGVKPVQLRGGFTKFSFTTPGSHTKLPKVPSA